MIETSDDISALAKALPKAQAAITKVSKDAANPHFNSKYVSLTQIAEAVIPALNANGISVLQPVMASNGSVQVMTVLLHETGQWLRATHSVPVSRNDAQGVGSALTYARRQGLQALLTVAPAGEDDDGEGAVGRGSAKPPLPPKEPERPGLPDRVKRLEGIMANVKTVKDLTKAWTLSNDLRAELEKENPAELARLEAARDAKQAELIGGPG